MKVVMNEEDYAKGVGEFLFVYYKDWIKSKSFKNLITIFAVSVSLFLVFGFMSGDIKAGVILLLFVVVGALIVISTIYILSKFAKKRKYNITKVEYDFSDKIYAISCIGEESITKEQYSYSKIVKVVESEEYFYLFVSKYLALTVKKTQELNREEFLDLMIDKKIFVKEYR